MIRELISCLRIAFATLLVTGVLYPLAVTVVAGSLFPGRAGGSLVEDERGKVVGSELLGQRFTSPAYLHPRPSAAGEGYDGAASSGSNLGPTSQKLRDRALEEAGRQKAQNPHASMPIPVDLVTASASGLDPHLSVEGALWQARRIGAARKVPEERIAEAIREIAEERDLGLLGEPRVNVLLANLALDRRFGKPDEPANR
jgi:K+-transporting ATPase ATPase C chain